MPWSTFQNWWLTSGSQRFICHAHLHSADPETTWVRNQPHTQFRTLGDRIWNHHGHLQPRSSRSLSGSIAVTSGKQADNSGAVFPTAWDMCRSSETDHWLSAIFGRFLIHLHLLGPQVKSWRQSLKSEIYCKDCSNYHVIPSFQTNFEFNQSSCNNLQLEHCHVSIVINYETSETWSLNVGSESIFEVWPKTKQDQKRNEWFLETGVSCLQDNRYFPSKNKYILHCFIEMYIHGESGFPKNRWQHISGYTQVWHLKDQKLLLFTLLKNSCR